MSSLPGITRQDEEKRLQHTLEIAQRKVDANRQSVQALAEELHAMQEEFDENDKEAQALWHNADARFKFVNQDLRRAEQARKKPYFGRIDFRDKKLKKNEVYYIGRSVIADNPAEPEVIDWRAPIASVYYDAALGDVSYSVKGEGKYDITLSRKRTYEIENDELKDFYDSDVVANDELLTKYLAKNKKAVLGEIIATIQKEQNLSLNPTKISGVCGRLMCCLKNEAETYEYLNSRLPNVGDTVTTIDGCKGEVQSINVLRQLVKVLIEVNDEKELREYKVKELKFKPRRRRDNIKLSPEEMKELEALEDKGGKSKINDVK